MTTKERIFQAILFETTVLVLSFFLLHIISNQTISHPTNSMVVVIMLISISLIAMIWTFVYNIGFDKVFTGEKLSRPWWLRAIHILGFEGGLLCLTLPLVMWVMQVGLWQAFLMDISLTLMVLVYGFVFYWVYDKLRAKLLN